MFALNFASSRLASLRTQSIGETISAIWRTIVIWAAALAFSVASLSTSAALGEISPWLKPLGIISYLFDLWLCVVVHELGHACAAKLVGWRVHVIAIGRRGYLPFSRRIVHLSRPYDREIGGWVFATPRPSNVRQYGYGLFIFGGPLANLLSGCLALAIASAFDTPLSSAMFGGFAVASFVVGIGNLVPFSTGKRRHSDGAKLLTNFLSWFQPSPARQPLWLYSLGREGVDPEDWDKRLIDEAEDWEGTESSQKLLRDAMLVAHYFGVGDVLRARAVTERHMRTANKQSPYLMLSHAFLIALLDHDVDGAYEILNALPEDRKDTFAYWRAMAAVRSVAGDQAGARDAVARARALKDRDEAQPDADDDALFFAIEHETPLPKSFSRGDTR